MSRHVSCALATVTLFVLSPATGSADAACKNPQTQTELDECAGKDAQAADAELNRVYRVLLEKYDEDNRKALALSERAWILYRDTECAFETAPTSGGTIHPMMIALCTTAKTKMRIKELNDQLSCKEGDMGCNAP